MLAALSGPTPMWYATRASGYTALVLLSLAVVLGLITSLRESRREWPRFVVQSLHRNVSLLVVVFLVLHILTSIIDPFAKLTFLDAVVPFVASYRPLWLGLGVVSFELLVAITATSLLRHRVGWRTWRAVHLLAYVSWPVAVVHGVATGTDTKSWWALLLVTLCVAVVAGALAWRLAHAGPGMVVLRATGAVVSVATVGLLAIWIATGPLQPGWAKAAGTPADLLAGTPGGSTPAKTAPLPPGLNDQLQGSIVQSSTNVTATMTDDRDPTLGIVITANADGSGAVRVSRSGVTLCNSAASIGNTSASAQCGLVVVTIQLAKGTGASLGGTLTTRPASS